MGSIRLANTSTKLSRISDHLIRTFCFMFKSLNSHLQDLEIYPKLTNCLHFASPYPASLHPRTVSWLTLFNYVYLIHLIIICSLNSLSMCSSDRLPGFCFNLEVLTLRYYYLIWCLIFDFFLIMPKNWLIYHHSLVLL